MITTNPTNGKPSTSNRPISAADLTAGLRLEADRIRTAVADHEARIEELEAHLRAERSRACGLKTVLQHLDNSAAYLDHTLTPDGGLLPKRDTLHRRGLAGANIPRTC